MNFVNKFSIYLQEQNYNESTIESYCGYLTRYLKYIEVNNQKISEEEIRKYILFLIENKQYSESTQNQTITVLKLFFKEILKKEINEFNFPRPRKSYKNPEYLSEEEVTKILKNIESLKYKGIVYLIYYYPNFHW